MKAGAAPPTHKYDRKSCRGSRKESVPDGTEQRCSGNTNTKHRSYFFTINNPDEATEASFREYPCKYLIYQIERGSEGTVHLQGTIHFDNPRAFAPMKKAFPTAHIEVVKDLAACFRYCSKEDTRVRGPYEKGIKPQPGKRNDLVEVHQNINNGVSVLSIRQEDPMLYHQYGRTLNQLETDAKNKNIRTEMTLGIWIFGSTGKGKSHKARELCKNKTVYTHTTKDKGWWDRYDQQDMVIIDDFRGEIDYNEILKLCDKWEHYVIRRGKDPVSFTSETIIITSSLPPHQVYKNRVLEDSLDQLKRRFVVWDMDKNIEWDWNTIDESSWEYGVEHIIQTSL